MAYVFTPVRAEIKPSNLRKDAEKGINITSLRINLARGLER